MNKDNVLAEIGERLLIRSRRVRGGCIEWTGSRDSHGYGTLRVRGVHMRAHRASVIAFGGSIPPGMFVCHECDNPPCINPLHLFVGTHADNMRDMAAKGRTRGGRRKLLPPSVKADLHRRRSEGETLKAIAASLRLTPAEAHELFAPPSLIGNFSRIPPAQAVAVLRHLAETGEVDWTIADTVTP